MHDIIRDERYPYAFMPSACSSCGGRCCTGESGYIYVNKAEIERIANFLAIEKSVFVEKYLYKKGYKYSLRERRSGENYECIFFEAKTNTCRIYAARPLQCRTFPFWEYYKTRVDELKTECPGIVDV